MKKINLNTCWSLKILGDNVYHIPENEIPAKVPGSVYSTLLDNGLMPDPFYRANELDALKLISNRLKACCDDGRYFIARYGGDEFAAICSMKNKDEAERFSQSIKSELQKKSSGYSYGLLVSIGYAVLIDSMHKESDFIRYADAALYREKIEIR